MMSIKMLGSALAMMATVATFGVLGTPANAAASHPAASHKAPVASPMGLRTVCATDAWVREADLSHVIGVLYRGDTMSVDRYVWKSTGASEWAVGTAHTGTGDHYGYVEYYPSDPFC